MMSWVLLPACPAMFSEEALLDKPAVAPGGRARKANSLSNWIHEASMVGQASH